MIYQFFLQKIWLESSQERESLKKDELKIFKIFFEVIKRFDKFRKIVHG